MSRRTGQEGPRLHVGWKSHVSQWEVKAEFVEDIERAGTDGPSRRLGKEKSMSLLFVQGVGFLLKMVVCCPCRIRHPGIG